VRKLLEEGDTSWTGHAKREMAKDSLTVVDVINVLRGGVVEEPEYENGAWRYRVRTPRIVVVFELKGDQEEEPDEISVVTAWRNR
jgi:hypothetical protein